MKDAIIIAVTAQRRNSRSSLFTVAHFFAFVGIVP